MSDSVSEVNSSMSAAVPTKISNNWESWSLFRPPAAGINHFPNISKMSRIWFKASIQSLGHTEDSGIPWVEYGNEKFLCLLGPLLDIRIICNILWSHPVKSRRGKCSGITSWKATFKQFNFLWHMFICFLREWDKNWYHFVQCPIEVKTLPMNCKVSKAISIQLFTATTDGTI